MIAAVVVDLPISQLTLQILEREREREREGDDRGPKQQMCSQMLSHLSIF